jgi:Flp pilus assembly protein TadG
LQRHRTSLRRNSERGIIITLVAVFMLFVIGAMAALSIDVVTFYTARSEAQLAADAAALAGARVLANSGMTSDPTAATDNFVANAEIPASTMATQVATSNNVGGRNLNTGEVTVTFNDTASSFVANPHVTVQVQRTDLPTFFARIWGRTQVTVGASATAEAYNPSYLSGSIPVAPICVKPWLLPNKSPNPAPASPQIFDPATGAILDTNLLGWPTPPGFGQIRLRTKCSTASVPPGTADCLPASSNTPTAWQYYPGDPADFPPPSAASVECPSCTTPYQLSIAGCIQTPITCNAKVNVDETADATRDAETGTAVDSLTHSTANEGDSVDTAVATPTQPFQFLAGGDNPVVQSGAMTSGTDVMVSDSLVTVPVIDTTPAALINYPQVQIIGFVQLFLNPNGRAAATGHIRTQVINLVGCGTPAGGGANAPPPAILGNGASPVTVRLISPP